MRGLPLRGEDIGTGDDKRGKRYTERKGLPRQILVRVGLADFCGNYPHPRRRMHPGDLQIQRIDLCLAEEHEMAPVMAASADSWLPRRQCGCAAAQTGSNFGAAAIDLRRARSLVHARG